jgi:hypothetical protein
MGTLNTLHTWKIYRSEDFDEGAFDVGEIEEVDYVVLEMAEMSWGGVGVKKVENPVRMSENSEPWLQRSSRWTQLACRWSMTSAVEHPAKAKLAGVVSALDLGPNGNANGYGI